MNEQELRVAVELKKQTAEKLWRKHKKVFSEWKRLKAELEEIEEARLEEEKIDRIKNGQVTRVGSKNASNPRKSVKEREEIFEKAMAAAKAITEEKMKVKGALK